MVNEMIYIYIYIYIEDDDAATAINLRGLTLRSSSHTRPPRGRSGVPHMGQV